MRIFKVNMHRQRVSLIITSFSSLLQNWRTFNSDKDRNNLWLWFFVSRSSTRNWLPRYSHWIANSQTQNYPNIVNASFFPVYFKCIALLRVGNISGNLEKKVKLLCLNWTRYEKANYIANMSAPKESEKNAITFINKSNACCGYFVMRLSLHGIALMCLCFVFGWGITIWSEDCAR